MANRWLNALNYTFEKATVTVYGDVTIGAVGAPTLVAAKSKGVKSITRNGAGDYTVVFSDQYNRFLSGWVGFIKATAPTASNQATVTSVGNAAGGATWRFVLYNNAGAATDPASGEELIIEVTWSNTTAV